MYKIIDECLSCGRCESVCPQEAIYMGYWHYEIDPNKCNDCGKCEENGCVADAIIQA